tara:strand:- start:235 stop:477 length:243 start_codon:yes stop_codon:yes gene_type:complete
MTIQPIFKTGDLVQSAPDSSDVKMMKATWTAEVIEVRQGVTAAPDGCCYITIGRWSDQPDAEPTSRQLWAKNLTFLTPLS